MTGIATPLTELMVATWRKSSHSGGEGNECVEIATLRTQVAIRDSKVTHGATLVVSADAFAAFVEGVTRR
ncbi:DUF397 domain-containing protein [Streptomyces sp. HC307]|uniref:DUF397 domain-containing protein n=1 Tax=Streptomyces flavusporus TaxID=3385496 RepID=UPI0039171634